MGQSVANHDGALVVSEQRTESITVEIVDHVGCSLSVLAFLGLDVHLLLKLFDKILYESMFTEDVVSPDAELPVIQEAT